MSAPSCSTSTSSYASSPPKTLDDFWPKQQAKIDLMTQTNFREVNRHSELPIARIKKIMKIEEGLKTQMISAEAPVLLAKAAELFIEELTLRSWLHTHENRRKTIQKADVTSGAAKSEMFDFLIDILPREDGQRHPEDMAENMDGIDEQGQSHQNIQYILQYTDGAMPSMLEPQVINLDNGSVIQATQIGQPIPLSSTTGQPIMMATIPSTNSADGHFQLVQVPATETATTTQQQNGQ